MKQSSNLLAFNTQRINRYQAFTLLEVMIVIAIIAILATLAMPSQLGRNNQKKIVETLELIEPYKGKIKSYYFSNERFPNNNVEAGLPEPEKIIGNYLSAMTVDHGVIHLSLGNKFAGKDQVLSVYPVYVKDSLDSPISWVCGYDQIPEGMTAAGENLTNVDKFNLPMRCW